MKKEIKQVTDQFFKLKPVKAFLRKIEPQGVCLMYHQVLPSESISSAPFRFKANLELIVLQSEFENQMKFLSQSYRCISMEQAAGEISNGQLSERSVVVTFDDGYWDNFAFAYPILKQYGVPATIYVVESMIDQVLKPWWLELEVILIQCQNLIFSWNNWLVNDSDLSLSRRQDYFNRLLQMMKTADSDSQSFLLDQLRGLLPKEQLAEKLAEVKMMTWDQAKTIAQDPLITLGTHTKSHPVLCRLSESVAWEEISDSKKSMEYKLGRSMDHFAYPFGSNLQVTQRELRMASQASYHSAVVTKEAYLNNRTPTRLHSIPRVAVSYHDTLLDFEWKLKGLNPRRWFNRTRL